MPKVRIIGTYKGSKQNGGRPITIEEKIVNGKKVRVTQNAARALYEKATGKKLPRNVDVDHKDNKGRIGGKKHDKMSNLDPLPHGKNVAKENKVRAKKK